METTDQIANTLAAALCAFGAVWSQLLDRPLVIDELSRSTEFSLRGRLPERGHPDRDYALALRQTAATIVDCWGVLDNQGRQNWLDQADETDQQLLAALLAKHVA
jgi:hypothetical protein